MSYGYPFVTKSTVNIYGFLATPAAVRAFSRRVRNEQLHGRNSSSNMLLEEVYPSTFGGSGSSVLLKPQRGLRGQLPPPRPRQPPAAPIAGPPADAVSDDTEPDAEMGDARNDAANEEPPVNEEDDVVGDAGGERAEKREVDYSVPATKYRDIITRYNVMKNTTSTRADRAKMRLNLKTDLNTLDYNWRPLIADFTRMLDDNQRDTIQLVRELNAMKALYAALNELVPIREALNNLGPNTEPRVDEDIWAPRRGRIE